MTRHTHRKDDGMTSKEPWFSGTGTPDDPYLGTGHIESTLVTHDEEVERRLDLLKRCAKIADRSEVRATPADLIALVEFVEAARKPSGSGILTFPSIMFETSDLSPEGFATMTGQAVPPGTPGASSAAFEWPIGDVQTVDNNVGDGSDVDTDVWPAAVPPPDYDVIDDGDGSVSITDSTTSEGDVPEESTNGKDD